MESKQSAIQLLRDDHKSMRGIFRQTEAVERRAPSMSEGVFRELLMKLQIHSKMEEEIFYPALLESVDAESRGLVEECVQDHSEADRLVLTLQAMFKDFGSSSDARILSRVDELIQNVELHMRKEEDDLFFIAEKTMSPQQLTELGGRLKARQEELLRSPQFKDALPERAQNPNGGEQMRKVS